MVFGVLFWFLVLGGLYWVLVEGVGRLCLGGHSGLGRRRLGVRFDLARGGVEDAGPVADRLSPAEDVSVPQLAILVLEEQGAIFEQPLGDGLRARCRLGAHHGLRHGLRLSGHLGLGHGRCHRNRGQRRQQGQGCRCRRRRRRRSRHSLGHGRHSHSHLGAAGTRRAADDRQGRGQGRGQGQERRRLLLVVRVLAVVESGGIGGDAGCIVILGDDGNRQCGLRIGVGCRAGGLPGSHEALVALGVLHLLR